jgi:predicted acylesterase/phospholipase RssA
MSDTFTVYVLPISGPKFPVQLGFLELIYDSLTSHGYDGSSSYSPSLVLSTSGGNICAYLGLSSQWDSQMMRNKARELTPEMFISDWCRLYPSWSMFPWTGALFRPGTGPGNLFRSIFTRDTVKATEIWTGTYNATREKAQLFCNLSEENSCLRSHMRSSGRFENRILNHLPHEYLDGHVARIASVSLASASIPVLTKGVEIDGDNYLDGGIMYSSPLPILCDDIKRKIKASCKPLRLIYFSSNPICDQKSSISLAKEINSLLIANCILDQKAAISLLSSISDGEETSREYERVDRVVLREILKETESLHTVIFMYPKVNISISMFNFSHDDVVEASSLAKLNCDCTVITREFAYARNLR